MLEHDTAETIARGCTILFVFVFSWLIHSDTSSRPAYYVGFSFHSFLYSHSKLYIDLTFISLLTGRPTVVKPEGASLAQLPSCSARAVYLCVYLLFPHVRSLDSSGFILADRTCTAQASCRDLLTYVDNISVFGPRTIISHTVDTYIYIYLYCTCMYILSCA